MGALLQFGQLVSRGAQLGERGRELAGAEVLLRPSLVVFGAVEPPAAVRVVADARAHALGRRAVRGELALDDRALDRPVRLREALAERVARLEREVDRVPPVARVEPRGRPPLERL